MKDKENKKTTVSPIVLGEQYKNSENKLDQEKNNTPKTANNNLYQELPRYDSESSRRLKSTNNKNEFEFYKSPKIASDEAYRWLKNQQDIDDNGFVQSFEENWEDGSPKQIAYTYDQAVASIAFLLKRDNERADKILDIMAKIQDEDGSWINSYWSNNSTDGKINGQEFRKHVGPVSWMTLAVMSREKLTGDTSSPKAQKYRQMAVKALDWCLKFEQPNGGIAGGETLWNTDGNGYSPEPYSSTEHNLDMYAALDYFKKVLPDKKEKYSKTQEGIKGFLDNVVWDNGRKTFQGGYNNKTKKLDNLLPLDVNPWSILAIGTQKPYGDTLKSVEKPTDDSSTEKKYRHSVFYKDNLYINGYDFNWKSEIGKIDDNNESDLRNALTKRTPDIWFEGSAFMSLAYERLGDRNQADKIISEISKAQGQHGSNLGGVPYSLRGSSNGYWNMSTQNCVSSTGWLVMAIDRFNPFMGEKILKKEKTVTQSNVLSKDTPIVYTHKNIEHDSPKKKVVEPLVKFHVIGFGPNLDIDKINDCIVSPVVGANQLAHKYGDDDFQKEIRNAYANSLFNQEINRKEVERRSGNSKFVHHTHTSSKNTVTSKRPINRILEKALKNELETERNKIWTINKKRESQAVVPKIQKEI